MKIPKMAKSSLDAEIAALARQTEKRTLAIWAADCAERVLPHFEQKSKDVRPRQAIEACREWVRSGIFRMKDVRAASLGAHAAARAVETENTARSAARAAGQAMATAHVPDHAIAAAIYAATAVRDASPPAEAAAATLREREWQLDHLQELRAQMSTHEE